MWGLGILGLNQGLGCRVEGFVGLNQGLGCRV